jgi:centrosomal protein CEP76
LDNRVNIRQGQRVNKEYAEKSNDEFIKHNKLQKEDEIKVDDRQDLSKIKEFVNFSMPKRSDVKIRNDVLPYKTIDVIFNKRNIWINLQHHNPAGIFYDIYDRDRWLPLFRKTETDRININHSDIPAFYSFKNFCPPFPEDDLITMKKNIIKSICNGFKLTRNQKNYSTNIKKVNVY